MAMGHAGVSRHAYNWAVNVCQKAFEDKEKMPSAIDLHKKLVAEVKAENNWYYNYSKCAPQEALRNLEKAYKNFHRKQKASGYKLMKTIRRKGVPVKVLEGLPQFKKKGIHDSFYLEGNIHVEGNKIKAPKMGWLKCSESINSNSPIKNVTISRTAGHWYISFKQEKQQFQTEKKKSAVGVDLGVKTLATLSDGTVFESIKPYNKFKRKLRIAQRIQSKRFVKSEPWARKPQSNNYKRAASKVAKLHKKISDVRNDYTHKITSYLAQNHSEIVIETLNIKGMSKNHKLASAILDSGFFEFKRQLEYKCNWYGSVLTKVDMFYPSSKTCSHCGHKKSILKLSERTFKCEECGFSMDRDLNASINLRNKTVSYTVSLGCGEVKPPEYRIPESL
jgi:putative transposase